MLLYPEEAISLPINGEPQITNNKCAINQEWCKNDTLNKLSSAGDQPCKIFLKVRLERIMENNG